MYSGYPHSQGGAYPAVQHKSNVYAPTSHWDNNVTPAPVGHPANGVQINQVASEYPEGIRLVHSPAQRQQGNAQPYQNFQGLHHQQKSQASIARTGFQHPRSCDSAHTPHNRGHHPSQKADADFHSAPHTAAQRSSYFDPSANENSMRQYTDYNSGQQKEHFSGHVLKGSNLNNNTNLQQRQHINSAFSAGTSSVALMRDTAQTFPVQDHRSSAPNNKQQTSSLLLHASLTGSYGHFNTTPSFFSEQSNTNVELNTSASFSCERYYKSQQVKSSPYTVNYGRTRTQNLLEVGETEPPPDDQIKFMFREKVKYFTMVSSQEEGKVGQTSFYTTDRTSTLQSDGNTPKSSSHHSTTSASDKEERPRASCAEQYTAAVGRALQDSLKGGKANAAKSKDTEYPQIMAKVAATCTKNGDKSPLVLVVSEMTLDGLTEKDPSLLLNCSSSKEEDKSLWFNSNKNLDEMDKVPSVSLTLKHMMEKEKEDTGLKPIGAIGLDPVQGSVVLGNETFVLISPNKNQDKYTNKKKNTEDQHHHVTCQEVITHSKLNQIQIDSVISLPTDQSEWLWNQTSGGGVMKDAGSVCSQTDLNLILYENKFHQSPLLPESKREGAQILKDPRFEDISDDEDTSQPLTSFPKTEHEELSLPPCFEEPQYEDISEDDNPQVESSAVETSSLTQVPDPTFKNEDYGPVQGQAQMETGQLDTAQRCSCPCSGETDDLLCPECDSERHLGWETNHSVSCSPSSLLKEGDETDEEVEDDYIVIPVKMSDIKFVPDAQDVPETVVLDDGETGDKNRHSDTNATHLELHCPVPEPVPASPSSVLEEFPTIQIFLQTKAEQYGTSLALSGTGTPGHEMDSEREPHTPQNIRESISDSEDSCETEDSCDYSSALEHNYMTVSAQLLKKRLAPPETDESESESEKESEHDEATNMQKSQTRRSDKSGYKQKLRELMEAKAGSKHVQPETNRQKTSEKEDVIILDSDTEDESDQNYTVEVKEKRLFHKNRLPSAASPASQHHEEVDDGPALSNSTETSGQLSETKACSEHVQHETITKTEDIIILDSDTEDDSAQNYTQASRGRSFSPGVVDSDRTPCVQQNGRSPETVDSELGTAKEKLKETRLSPADSSAPQHQSKPHAAQFKEVRQDTCDLSLSIKKIKAKGASERGQHQSNRQPTSQKTVLHDPDIMVRKDSQISKKNKTTERTFSPVSKHSGDALFAVQKKKRPSTETVNSLCQPAKKKLQKRVFSSDDSPEKQPQSVDEEAHSTPGPKPVISHLFVKKSYQSSNDLKILKEPYVHRRDADETPRTKNSQRSPKISTAASKKTDSCEKNMQLLHRDEQGKFMHKPKPANDRHCAAKNKVQAKPRLVSRQMLLPCLEGPSTSASSSISTSGQRPETRQISEPSQSGETSAFSSPAKTMQNTSDPRQGLSASKLKLSHSYSSPSTLGHPSTCTKGPSSRAPMSARERVHKDWNKRNFAARRTSMGREKALRSTNHESLSKVRPGPSLSDRQRHNSHQSAPPLLKRCRFEAREMTKARNRDVIREQRHFTSEGYKWSEKPRASQPAQGSIWKRRRWRSPQRSHW